MKNGSTPTWSYEGDDGPEFWEDNFPICGESGQSPIALKTSDAVGDFPYLEFGFKNYDVTPTKFTVENNGHTAEFHVELAGGEHPQIIGGDLDHLYELVQFHFHWGSTSKQGSEHTIDGRQFPAELHLVHFRVDYGDVGTALGFSDGLAVLGIMLEISDNDNPDLDELIASLANIHEPETEGEVDPFKLELLLPSDTTKFFRYHGSLTTPPCNEIVRWTVFNTPISISERQIEEFRKLFDEFGNPLVDNFRPTQPINDRQVQKGAINPHWSYHGDIGPDTWPTNFAQCGGQRQSPIALNTLLSAPALTFPDFVFTNFDVTPTQMILSNNGHTSQVTFTMPEGVDNPSVTGGGLEGRYIVLQFHVHWGSTSQQGSEHTIDGIMFPAELHIVMYSERYGDVTTAMMQPDGLAVLGVMFSVAATDNGGIASVVAGLPNVDISETETEIVAFPLANLLPSNTRTFFRYEGSLTTPPCLESVIWTVFPTTYPVSETQLQAFREIEDEIGDHLVDNFRPPQPLFDRQVLLKKV